MKLTTTCVPCLLKRVAYEVDLCRKERTMRALAECANIVARKASSKISSAEFATEIHRRAYEIIGRKDPYWKLKKRSNEVALGLARQARRIISSSRRPLREAMRLSIVGNVLDFGISGSVQSPSMFRKEFYRILREPLGWNDSEEIERLIRTADEVVFLADNCGEIIFDGILMEEIRQAGPRVVLVVKGEPILTDVTKKDLEDLHMDKVADEVLETEGMAVGINLWDRRANNELRKRMCSADLIISKGMANFEAVSEHEWNAVAYLLRTKCEPVSKALGVRQNANIIKLVRGRLN